MIISTILLLLALVTRGEVACATTGDLAYKLFIPQKNIRSTKQIISYPLVVALHGCKQNADKFADLTRLNTLAQKEQFMVLYPEQSITSNIDHCWNWFFPFNQKRNWGELKKLQQLVSKIKAKYPVQSDKIFTLGLSAGGAMANLLAYCYRDTFKAVAIHSGLQFAAATNPLEAQNILLSMSHLEPEKSALKAYQCNQEQKGPLPVFIIVGDADKRLNPAHSMQILQQAIFSQDYLDDGLRNNSHKVVMQDKKIVALPNKHRHILSIYGSQLHPSMIQYLVVEKMEHAWSGGPLGLPNSDPLGVDATLLIWNFFNSIK